MILDHIHDRFSGFGKSHGGRMIPGCSGSHIGILLVCLYMLCGCGGDKPLDSLIALEVKDPELASRAEVLVSKMRSSDPDVSLSAAEEMIKLGKPVVPVLIELLGDDRGMVRGPSAHALGVMKDKRAIKPIRKLLKDKDWRVRASAAAALCELRDEKSLLRIIGMLRDKEEGVRDSAAWGLKHFSGKDFGKDYRKWMNWYSQRKKSSGK
jgi:HEAT repeat protein